MSERRAQRIQRFGRHMEDHRIYSENHVSGTVAGPPGEDETVLVIIYLCLAVNPSGVLESDLERFELVCHRLRESKLAVRNRVGRGLVLRLTEAGRIRCSQLLLMKLESCRETVAAFLRSKPPKIVTFLINHYFRYTSSHVTGTPFIFGTDW